MGWNLEGLFVKGLYLDEVEVSGRVSLSRVEYGGNVSHHIAIDNGFAAVGGRVRRNAGEVIIVDHKNILEVTS